MKHLRKGDQFVVACVESPETAHAVIAAARYFAERLRDKQLMVMNVSPKEKAGWLKDYGIPYVAMQGDWGTAIEGLPTAFNAVLAVTAVDTSAPRSSITNPSTLLRTFRRCKIAYLAVPKQTEAPKYENGALTVDYQRESKEKLIWASYLARFLGAKLTIATPRYRDAGLRELQDNNIRYIDKVFPPLGITYNSERLDTTGKRLRANPDWQALEALHPDILVARATDPRATDPLDWIFGTPDRKLLSHPSHTPILFLNPRDDLYILCD
jgi:hypothetical protein